MNPVLTKMFDEFIVDLNLNEPVIEYAKPIIEKILANEGAVTKTDVAASIYVSGLMNDDMRTLSEISNYSGINVAKLDKRQRDILSTFCGEKKKTRGRPRKTSTLVSAAEKPTTPKKREPTAEEIQELCNQGKKQTDIATIYGVERHKVKQWFKKFNIKSARKLAGEWIQKETKRLNTLGYSDNEIAKMLGVSHGTTTKVRRAANLPSLFKQFGKQKIGEDVATNIAKEEPVNLPEESAMAGISMDELAKENFDCAIVNNKVYVKVDRSIGEIKLNTKLEEVTDEIGDNGVSGHFCIKLRDNIVYIKEIMYKEKEDKLKT